MLYALLEGVKREAVPNTNAICPICKKNVFSRCGEVYVWHWAHRAHEDCIKDSFVKPDTYWQEKWKKIFGADKSEILIHRDGKSHIADIFSNGIVIMLYDSIISKRLIGAIEAFFGEKMFWVINGQGQGFKMQETELSLSYQKYFNKTFDVQDGKVIEKETGEVLDGSRMYRPIYEYIWSSKLCTNGANALTQVTSRHVFVDNSDEGFFFISNDTDKCKKILIEDFLKKYV